MFRKIFLPNPLTSFVKANAFSKELEELSKHSVHKSREQHHHHHGMHLFHLPGHHSHNKEHGQQQVSGEKYREVSSAIDEPATRAQASSSPSAHFKLTVGSPERVMMNPSFAGCCAI